LRTVVDVMVRTGHLRIPIYDGEPDNIVGIVYVKDVLRAMRADGGAEPTLEAVSRPSYFVPETVPIDDLLRNMQRERVQMAVVTDEHGDVAGLLTLEDIVEEIVGDITDEDGIEERLLIELGPNRWRVRGLTRVREFNELIEAELPEDEEWTTIAGLVSTTLAKIPEPGDTVTADGFTFRVETMSGRRIDTVLVERTGGLNVSA
jgi:putative hemolysin